MFTFDEKRFCEPSGHYPPERPRYTMTEEVEHTARQMRETIDRLLKFEERVKADVDSMLKHVSGDNVVFKSTMRDSWVTFIDEVKREINQFESNVDATVTLFNSTITSDYSKLSEDMQLQIDGMLKDFNDRVTSFEEAIDSRIEAHNNTYSKAFEDYQQKLTTQINMHEATVNTTVTNFMNGVNASIETFRSTWEQIITDRLNTQDARISDAEAYMVSNITATVTTLIGDMKDSGELSEIIQGEVFNDLTDKINRIISPEFYGAKGDGVTDDTKPLQQCLTNNSFVLLKGKYKISEPLVFDNLSNVVLFGGEITRATDKTFNTVTGTNCSNIHINNVVFDGNGNNREMDYEWMENVQGCILLVGDAFNIFVEKCTIKNFNYGIYVLGAELTDGIDSVNATIKDCIFRNCHSAIDTHGKNTLIDHNSFYNITENAIQIESEGTPQTDNPLIDNAFYYSAVCSRISNNMLLGVNGTAIIIHDNAYGVKVDNNTIIDFNYGINANRDFRGCFIENNILIYQQSRSVTTDKRPWDLSFYAIYCGKNTHVKNNYLKGCYVGIMGREGAVISGNEIVSPKISAIVVSSSDPTLIHFINDNIIKDFVKNVNAWWGSLPIVLNSGMTILNNNLVYADSEPIHSENAKAKVTNLYSTTPQSTVITALTTNVYNN